MVDATTTPAPDGPAGCRQRRNGLLPTDDPPRREFHSSGGSATSPSRSRPCWSAPRPRGASVTRCLRWRPGPPGEGRRRGAWAMPAYRTIDDIFLGDVEFWTRPISEREEAFAALRQETHRGGGMCFHEEVTVIGGDSAGPGYWSAVTWDDVQAVSRNQQCFSSASGVISNDPAPEYLAV